MTTKLRKAVQKLGSWKAEFNEMRKERRAHLREIANLKHDIESQVAINAELTTECERLRAGWIEADKIALASRITSVRDEPISEAMIPLRIALFENCKGCGKRPVDFAGAENP